MKKTILFILALLAILTICACTNAEEKEVATEVQDSVVTVEVDTTVAKPAECVETKKDSTAPVK